MEKLFKYLVKCTGTRVINGITCKAGDEIELDSPDYRSAHLELITEKVKAPKKEIKVKKFGGEK